MSTDSEQGSIPVEEVPGANEAQDAHDPTLIPAKNEERIASLDFVRGLAVMGILFANIMAFGQPWTAYMYPDAFLVDDGDPTGVWWIAQFVLIDGKMRGLFTLLFGASMVLFLERAWARGATRWLQARRLVWLGLFGLVHFFFIWRGDILFLYAVCGLFALLLVRLKPLNLFVLGGLGYFFGGLFFAGAMSFSYLAVDTEMGEKPAFSDLRSQSLSAKAESIKEAATDGKLISEGDYVGLVANNFAEHWSDPLMALFIGVFETIPLMLLGMALYKVGVFEGRLNPGKQKLWGWIGLLIGGAITLVLALWARENGFTYFGNKAAMIGYSVFPRILMVLGMTALLAVYGLQVRGWLADRVSAAGRAAFTNYLGTSIVLMFVFHGWALGLYGELNRPQLYIVALLTCGLMLLWSKPWLERFRYGPLEWLWRCLTYGKLFPLRR